MPPTAIPPSETSPRPLRTAGSEPVPGYRLLGLLGRGGFGEVWKCEAPGGLLKAIKFVPNDHRAIDDSAAPGQEELAAIQLVKGIRHPFLLQMERVEVIGDELVIVMELADQSLGDLLRSEQASGRPGLPQADLLGYLREAAEALDLMHGRHGLQHLDVKPHNLFLVSGHVKVGDFGLVSNCAPGKGPVSRAAISPLYASPEVFQGRVSPHSDQYSLAIVFQELLTGALPFTGKNYRHLLMQHLTAPPDLSPLPEADRAAVARALGKSPAERFPSCSDFVTALATGQADVVTATVLSESNRSGHARAETRPVALLKTAHVAAVRPPTLAHVRKLSLVRRTPLAEVWSGTGPDGEAREVQVLFGCHADEEAVARLAALSHPALVPLTVLVHFPGRLILSTPASGPTLRDALADCQARGLPGLPRGRALAYLRQAADVLQALSTNEGLCHLTLSPRALRLAGEQVSIADFGLAHLFWLPAGQSAQLPNTRYAAPELERGQAGPASDQYSLALIFHELLTGIIPPPGRRQAADLTLLTEGDRRVVARALAASPQHRWASLRELFDALEALGPAERLRPTGPAERAPPSPRSGALRMRFGTSLGPALIRDRLDRFRQQWQAERVGGEGRVTLLRMTAPQSLWRRAGNDRPPELQVRLTVGEPEEHTLADVPPITDVVLDLQPWDRACPEAAEWLDLVAPMLVESLRNHLRANARERAHERVPWHHPLRVCPVAPDGTLGAPIECQGKDISLSGVGFYLPGELPSAQVVLMLPPTPQTPTPRLPARIVRAQGCGNGWYEIGAALLPRSGGAVTG